MDSDWIDGTLVPALADVAVRRWTVESLREFVSDLSEMISAAVQSGELSREGARLARERVSASMATVPGVTTVTAADELEPLAVAATIERPEE